MSQYVKYFKHWLGYSYYRSVHFYTWMCGEQEYLYATLPFYTFFMLVYAILTKNGIVLAGNKGELLPYAIVMTIVLPLFFNKKKYDKMKDIFGTESNTTKIILGFLVAATFIAPVVMAVIYLSCF